MRNSCPLVFSFGLLSLAACGETGNDDGSETSGQTEDEVGESMGADTESGDSTDTAEGESGESESGEGESGESESESGESESGESESGEGESGEDDTDTDSGGDGDLPPFVADCEDDLANPIIVTVGGDSARFPSIVAGLAAASSGSTIEICPGSYSDNIVVTFEVTLRGAGPDLTIIDGGGFNFDLGNAEATVENMAFTNSNAVVPGGWNIQSSGAISVDDTYGEQETLTIRDCEFYGNSAAYGAAVHVDGSNNGGKNPDIYIESCLFEDNVATGEGGAIASYGRVHISDSIFLDNEARTGGALALSYGCTSPSVCEITDTIIQRNHANGTGEYEGGGGIFVDNCGFQCLSGLTVTSSDLGFGIQQENTDYAGLPQDVVINDGGSPWPAYGWYHNNVSFTCSGGTCTEP